MLDKILSFIAELISVRSGTIASGVTYTYRSGVCSVTANIMLTENTMTLLGTCPYRPAETIYSRTRSRDGIFHECLPKGRHKWRGLWIQKERYSSTCNGDLCSSRLTTLERGWLSC